VQSSREDHLRERREQVVMLCQHIIAGRLDMISGVRELRAILPEIGVDDLDDDFIVFVAFDSDTLDLPAGIVRARWHPRALESKDKEAAELEALYKTEVVAACNKLIERIQHTA
jgi:hypothetical protein